MSVLSLGFALGCGLCLVYLDDTHDTLRPWLAFLGLLVGIWGAVSL